MYNFDKCANRLNVSSLKWKYKDVLPMWVADMDFDTMPEVKNAIIDRTNLGALGYTDTPKEYFIAFKDFWKRHHHVDIDINSMIFSTGVVPAISSVVRKLTNVCDKIMVITPTYNIFFNSILNNNRIPVETDLYLEDGKYKLDFNDFENKIKSGVKMLILCNPQNPIGKIWDIEELKRIAKICKDNNVIVLSDEIHSDIVNPGKEYNSTLLINDFKDVLVLCISASKCFNLAGLQGACVVVPNESMRKLVDRGLNTDEVAEGNAFVYSAFISALNNGDTWLKEMNEYVYNNKKYLKEFIDKNIKEFKYEIADSLYLAWVDVSDICEDGLFLCNYLKDNAKVYFSYGEEYGKSFKGFIRINLATSFENLKEGLNRLLEGINLYKKEYLK
ncbi:MAG: aminotransferase class I/II-fold pyridoxal phosphate-dependent enzyme [Acholeplasmatales bacterium]|nr:aminotransferase class I/II-fold pyridoxal phosphate-dependent enzyme [Acholeplasmatales bacterium]